MSSVEGKRMTMEHNAAELMAKKVHLTEKASELDIPGYMVSSLVEYVVEGRPTGDFLSAIFSNDLKKVFDHADDQNRKKIAEYVFFLYNWCPVGCWGSPENHKEWIAHRGLNFVPVANAETSPF